MSHAGVLVADGVAQLVAHLLAHLRIDGPGNCFDPRYREWSRALLSADTQAMLEHDAELIAAAWRASPELDSLHEMFVLHRDLAGFRRTAGRALAELDARELADPWLLERLRGPAVAIAELFHASMALVDRELEAVLPDMHAERVAVEQWRARTAAWVPGLAAARVELVWGLGMHGRVLATRILVGAPAPWNGCTPGRQAVLAAHEYLVSRSESADYVAQEWRALTGLAHLLASSDDDELRRAHGDWLAELDLGHLLQCMIEAGGLEPRQAEAVEREAHERARHLAALH